MFLVNASSMFFNEHSGLMSPIEWRIGCDYGTDSSWLCMCIVLGAVVFTRETSALRGCSERKRKRTSFYWSVVLTRILSTLAAVSQGTPSLLQCLGGAKAKTNSRHFEVTLVWWIIHSPVSWFPLSQSSVNLVQFPSDLGISPVKKKELKKFEGDL